MKDIVTIGSITKDNFLEMDCEIINWPKTPLKKAIVLPFGEKLEVENIYSVLGGNSANASVTFSRLGFKTSCFGKIGSDPAGQEIKKWLKADGIDPIFAVAKNKKTAQSTLLLKAAAKSDKNQIGQGERTILGYHGASNEWVKNDIIWNKLKARWWYLSLAGTSSDFFVPLIKFAKKNGIKVAFNPSGYQIKHNRQEILDNLKNIDFLAVNEGEAADLVGISFSAKGGPASGWEREAFKKLDDLMPGIVAVTDGPNGVTVSDGENIYKAGIFKEKLVADRTGAGDAFGSGFTAGLMEYGKNFNSIEAIKHAIILGSANATSVVEKIGATAGIISKKNLKEARFKNLDIKIHPLT